MRRRTSLHGSSEQTTRDQGVGSRSVVAAVVSPGRCWVMSVPCRSAPLSAPSGASGGLAWVRGTGSLSVDTVPGQLEADRAGPGPP